ncbi:unnamed protein product, partial [Oncorhynchus mykiss]
MVKTKKTSTAAARKEPAQQLFVENPSEEDAAVVDKIMSSRIVKNEVAPGVIVEVEEFFVKYKNYSYLHCEWAVEQQLEKDKRIQQKIKRFKIKQAQRAHFFADVRPFHTSVCVCCVCVCLFCAGMFACISVVCFMFIPPTHTVIQCVFPPRLQMVVYCLPV